MLARTSGYADGSLGGCSDYALPQQNSREPDRPQGPRKLDHAWFVVAEGSHPGEALGIGLTMSRRFESIVDAARERSVAPPPQPKSAGLYAFQALLFSVLWWFWLYSIGHILTYLVVVGGPQLGIGETNEEVGIYLASFDLGIALSRL